MEYLDRHFTDDNKGKKPVKESKVITVYKVTIGFSEYSGATMDYEVVAEDEDDAIYMALEQAADYLEIENVDDLGDGTYDVYVRFSEYYGSMVHNVTADDEGEAEELALIEAANDDLEVVDVKLVSTPVTESRLVVQYFDRNGDSQTKEITGNSAKEVIKKLKQLELKDNEIYQLHEVSRDLKNDAYISQFPIHSIEMESKTEARINKITDFTEHSSGNMFIFRCEREDGLHEYFVGVDARWSDGIRFQNGDTIGDIKVADTLFVDGEKADTERGTLPIKYTKQDVAWQLKPGCIYTHKDIEQFYEDLKYLAAEDFAVDAWLFKILDHVTILDHIAKSGSPEYRTESRRRIKESTDSSYDIPQPPKHLVKYLSSWRGMDEFPTVAVDGTLWYDISQSEYDSLRQYIKELDRIPESVWRKWDDKTQMDVSTLINNAELVCRNSVIRATENRKIMENSVYDMNYSYDEFLDNGYKYITWYAENPLCMCLIMRLRNEDDSYDGVQLIPTVNFGHDIGNSTLMPKYCAFIDIYNNPEIDTWLEEKGLAEPYRRFGSDVEMQGNFGTYPLYQFSKEALKKYGFDGLDEYEENWQKEFEEEQAQMNKDFYSQYVQESNNKNWYESEFTQDERSAKDKLLKYLKTKSIPFEVSGIDAEIDGKMGSLGWNVRISASPEQAEEINTMIDNNEFE